jgi:hypothetical protein
MSLCHVCKKGGRQPGGGCLPRGICGEEKIYVKPASVGFILQVDNPKKIKVL